LIRLRSKMSNTDSKINRWRKNEVSTDEVVLNSTGVRRAKENFRVAKFSRSYHERIGGLEKIVINRMIGKTSNVTAKS